MLLYWTLGLSGRVPDTTRLQGLRHHFPVESSRIALCCNRLGLTPSFITYQNDTMPQYPLPELCGAFVRIINLGKEGKDYIRVPCGQDIRVGVDDTFCQFVCHPSKGFISESSS